jgi:hypothetical protein
LGREHWYDNDPFDRRRVEATITEWKLKGAATEKKDRTLTHPLQGRIMQLRSCFAVLFIAGTIRAVDSAAQAAPVSSVVPDVSAEFPVSWRITGANRTNYELKLDSRTSHSGHGSSYVGPIDGATDETWAGLIQLVRADDYVGKRVRFSGYIKSLNAGSAVIWMRVDGVNDGKPATMGFDNLSTEDGEGTRGATGTTDWKRCEIVLDIPQSAGALVIGGLVTGTGAAWFDDFVLEVVDKSVAPTGQADIVYNNDTSAEALAKARQGWLILPKAMLNGDFEGGKKGPSNQVTR